MSLDLEDGQVVEACEHLVEADLDEMWEQFQYFRGVTGDEEQEFKAKMRYFFAVGFAIGKEQEKSKGLWRRIRND